MNNENLLQINIEEIIKTKNPKLYKRLPSFVLKYIKKILHQDEINEFLRKNKDLKNISFINAALDLFKNKIVVYGNENIPSKGKFIFVANHPLGGIESLALIKIVNEKFPEKVKFFVNDVLLNLKNISDFFVPVNKYGAQNKELVKIISDIYYSDYQILYYPAGLVSRKIKGKIMDLPWKKQVLKKAKESERDIIPVFIEARNSERFYRIYQIRKMLGIKANIELFFLVDEMFKFRNRTIKFYFGKPIDFSTFDKKYSMEVWVQKLQNFVHFELKKNINAIFTP